MATIWKPWSAKMSELAIACPRCPAPNRTMLCWPEVRRILRISLDERVDAVADAALAELAEARQVAADLGRVDVGVLGQLLRGDRLLAHLAGLDQHLQVARQPRGDAEREALAVERDSVDRLAQSPAGSSTRRRCLRGEYPSAAGRYERRPAAARRRAPARRPPRRRPRPPGSARGSVASRRVVALDVDLAQLEGGALVAHRQDRARGPRRRGGSRAARTESRLSVVGVPERGSPGYGAASQEAGRRGDHRRVVGAELAGTSFSRSPRSSQIARRPLAQAARWRPPRRRAPRPPNRPPRARARAWRPAGRRRPPGSWRRGRRGGARPRPAPRSRTA